MKDALYIHAGHRGPKCRLGTIVTDIHGCPFGLSASHILQQSQDGFVYDPDGLKMGRVNREPLRLVDSEVSGSFSALIGQFELLNSPPCLTDARASAISSNRPVPGQRLRWMSGANAIVTFTVIGYGGEVAFRPSATGPVGYYEGPIVLALETSEISPGAGDAGSALLDDDGFAVGLLISADGSRFYAAALDEYAARVGVKSLRPQKMLAPPLSLGRDWFDEIAAVGEAAVANLYAGLSESTAVHTDPAGNHVPPHLLRVLEGVGG